ncbi:hypothetical protein [Chryseobacterium sp. OSA05B]|uniref:hypothetical protein n=1 Tax=Chryseobacterium sp. OSA05B TaxID=2862650 RepID=UPI001CBAA00F|nr:hypothetical protein [Chryseobacterium sp. OSA05B]
MPQKETEELHERLEKMKKTNSNAKQTDWQENTDFINKNGKTSSSQRENPQKGKGLRFLDAIMENGSFIKKALKSTAIGLVAGFALALLFPPLGIAIMAISAIAGIAAIGAKVAHNYNKTKAENNYNKENTETKAEIFTEIIRELKEEKFSKKEQMKQQEKNNGIEDDLEQNIEILTGSTRKKVREDITENMIKIGMEKGQKLSFDSIVRNVGTDHSLELRKSVIKNTNESGLTVFTKPLNSPDPNIKRDAKAPQSKAQKEMQSVNRNMGITRNKF